MYFELGETTGQNLVFCRIWLGTKIEKRNLNTVTQVTQPLRMLGKKEQRKDRDRYISNSFLT